MGKPIDYWPEATRHLARADRVMARLIDAYDGERLGNKKDAFSTLARAIVGQQISVKAADTVWGRLQRAAGKVTHRALAGLDEATLRACGLSQQKTEYLRALTEFFSENPSFARRMQSMDDAQVTRALTAIRGIGVWTAEMFLIFHLERPDVLPLADIGLQRAIEKHYNGSKSLAKPKLQRLAEPWRPWRSVATWYLWRSLDPVPVEY